MYMYFDKPFSNISSGVEIRSTVQQSAPTATVTGVGVPQPAKPTQQPSVTSSTIGQTANNLKRQVDPTNQRQGFKHYLIS